jgi:hypothetical protein
MNAAKLEKRLLPPLRGVVVDISSDKLRLVPPIESQSAPRVRVSPIVTSRSA